MRNAVAIFALLFWLSWKHGATIHRRAKNPLATLLVVSGALGNHSDVRRALNFYCNYHHLALKWQQPALGLHVEWVAGKRCILFVAILQKKYITSILKRKPWFTNDKLYPIMCTPFTLFMYCNTKVVYESLQGFRKRKSNFAYGTGTDRLMQSGEHACRSW